MKYHPGGAEHTRRMIALASLKPCSKVLDMGAGAGETVEILRSMGFDAVGIDLEPRGENVEKADFLHCPHSDGSFDAVISQCAFFVSGSVEKAFQEAYRVLKDDGILMLSDVFFQDAAEVAEAVGFTIVHREDMSAAWREYYLEALWRGETGCYGKGQCRYELLICKKCRGSYQLPAK